MFQALRPLAVDLAGSLVFAALLALKVDPAYAAVFGALTTVGMIGANLITKKPVSALQWFSLAVVIIFGTATFFTHDPRFLMIKPTLIYFALAGVMMKRGWLLQYIPAKAEGSIDDITICFGYAWAAMMFATGVANFVIAFWFHHYWLGFLAVFPTLSKLILFAIQYTVSRRIARRRLATRRAGADLLPAAAT